MSPRQQKRRQVSAYAPRRHWERAASRPALTACCMTAGPAARVAAILELLRPAVDELFVALDGRAGPEVAASVERLADRAISFNYREPVDRPIAWLHSRCE